MSRKVARISDDTESIPKKRKVTKNSKRKNKDEQSDDSSSSDSDAIEVVVNSRSLEQLRLTQIFQNNDESPIACDFLIAFVKCGTHAEAMNYNSYFTKKFDRFYSTIPLIIFNVIRSRKNRVIYFAVYNYKKQCLEFYLSKSFEELSQFFIFPRKPSSARIKGVLPIRVNQSDTLRHFVLHNLFANELNQVISFTGFLSRNENIKFTPLSEKSNLSIKEYLWRKPNEVSHMKFLDAYQKLFNETFLKNQSHCNIYVGVTCFQKNCNLTFPNLDTSQPINEMQPLHDSKKFQQHATGSFSMANFFEIFEMDSSFMHKSILLQPIYTSNWKAYVHDTVSVKLNCWCPSFMSATSIVVCHPLMTLMKSVNDHNLLVISSVSIVNKQGNIKEYKMECTQKIPEMQPVAKTEYESTMTLYELCWLYIYTTLFNLPTPLTIKDLFLTTCPHGSSAPGLTSIVELNKNDIFYILSKCFPVSKITTNVNHAQPSYMIQRYESNQELCFKCDRPIEGSCYKIESYLWHNECFKCCICKSPVEGFSPNSENIFCIKHFSMFEKDKQQDSSFYENDDTDEELCITNEVYLWKIFLENIHKEFNISFIIKFPALVCFRFYRNHTKGNILETQPKFLEAIKPYLQDKKSLFLSVGEKEFAAITRDMLANGEEVANISEDESGNPARLILDQAYDERQKHLKENDKPGKSNLSPEELKRLKAEMQGINKSLVYLN